MLFAPIVLQTITPMNTTVTTRSLSIPQVYGFAVQAIYTGTTIAGTLKLQASVDGTNWSDISGSSQALAAAGNFIFNVNGSFYLYLRAVFTDSGTTSVDARITILVFTKGV